MQVRVPVYTNHHGFHQINIYEQFEGGEFRRTPQRLLPHMLINFEGISESRGEVVSQILDRRKQEWDSPTVYFYLGRPMSFYRFLREHALDREIMVLGTHSMSVRVRKFTIHELIFKRNVATAVKALTARKFLEEIDIHVKPTLLAADEVLGSSDAA
ncbi:MAG TPA: hypothetical protein VIX81_01730 [Gammaproteobacteria bacterium]